MPQLVVAESDGWSDEYKGEGMVATRGFFDPVSS